MTRFHVFTDTARPGLHVWRESKIAGSAPFLKLWLQPVGPPANGWSVFQADLDPSNTSPIRYLLFEWNDQNQAVNFESDAFIRDLDRLEGGQFPDDVWFFKDTSTSVLVDPAANFRPRVRIHLVTAARYRQGLLYLWSNSEPGERFPRSGETASGPYWDLDLTGPQQQFFNFKFVQPGDPGQDRWEGNPANRTWTAWLGPEIWVKSETPEISPTEPQKTDTRYYLRPDPALPAPTLHLWQDGSDFSQDLDGTTDPANPGWLRYTFPIYSQLYYGARFYWRDPARPDWEDKEATRYFKIENGEADFWMLEGASAVLPTKPAQDVDVVVRVLQRTPDHRLDGNLFAHVWIDRSRSALHQNLPVDPAGAVRFTTVRGVTTSIKFHTDAEWESVDRHALSADEAAAHSVVYATLDRFQLLWEPPPVTLYADPPFQIRRPGVYEEHGFLHFVVHALTAARVRVWGEWMPAGVVGVDLVSTLDRTFWWTRIPVATVSGGLASGDYDGAEYHYLIDNDRQLQDPAAGWVVNSGFGANSKLVRTDKYVWRTQNWQCPSWDYLQVYQLHPSRFTPRNLALEPLRRVAWEIGDPAGYLRQVGAPAVLLLPVHEFPGDSSWGYNPAFYYAVESSYGGPHALKELVDTCHQNGIAVLLDLVLNHSGNDNPLWNLGRETFFDGDTKWGALVNFDNPQCKFFFAQCVAYLVEEFKVDGIRLDHTRTILHGNTWEQDIIKAPGSGGGWEFLQALKDAARRKGGANCIVVGEHLPNEWDVSRHDGPLDCQWCDDFHDRLLDAFTAWGSMGALADALKITHTQAGEWFNAMNYGESHDEVGNEDHRLAKVAGYGRGLRAAKVHAAAVLLSRGIPMHFMGAESAEWRQFVQNSDATLPLDTYLSDPDLQKVRNWWRVLGDLRRNPNFKGPAPIQVCFAQDRMVGFTRGLNGDYYILLNFGSWSGAAPLASLNLPDGSYRELWNSTWDEFRNASEGEQLRHSGGRNARLNRGDRLQIPEIAAVILERV